MVFESTEPMGENMREKELPFMSQETSIPAVSMSRYEKEDALSAIDGYWNPDPHFTESNAHKALERAKQAYRNARLRQIACVDAITLESFLSHKPYWSEKLKTYSQIGETSQILERPDARPPFSPGGKCPH
jgi:hypothetical protein